MALAIFDLDNTLLGGDSDYLWGQFLAERGVVDKTFHETENQRFYEEYKAGGLDIYEFLRFSLKPLKENPLSSLHAWRADFIEEKIRPLILNKARALVESHKTKNDVCLIITATNSFVTQPIAALYDIDILLATEPEMIAGEYTGEVSGTPCFQAGKVDNLNRWLAQNGKNMQGSYFYSDSHNDLPLLRLVDHPVAVDADDILLRVAETNDWPIISLR